MFHPPQETDGNNVENITASSSTLLCPHPTAPCQIPSSFFPRAEMGSQLSLSLGTKVGGMKILYLVNRSPSFLPILSQSSSIHAHIPFLILQAPFLRLELNSPYIIQ